MNESTRSREESVYSGTAFAGTPNAVPVPGYELLDEVGRGGMGIVWRANDLTLGREVAVKILQDRFSVDSPICERFLEEARITSQLQHPGIPAIYQVGTREDRRPFLAMKLIKGHTLDQLLHQNQPVNHAAVFEAIAQAVGYAHAHGVVHRDLKPSNVMVGAFGEVQVMDWGLAKVLANASSTQPPSSVETKPPTKIDAGRGSSDTEAGSVVGTPAYMAPEQAGGFVNLTDARTDVFGLGGILCYMLTGKPPYIGTDNELTRELAVHAKLDEAFARLVKSTSAPELVELCRLCLSKEKADRPLNGEAVARSVAKLRQDLVDHARQVELETARKDARRRTRRYAAGAVAAVLVLGIIGTTDGMLDAQKSRDQERVAKQLAEKYQAASDNNLDTAQNLTMNLLQVTESVLPRVSESDQLRQSLVESSARTFDAIVSQRAVPEETRRLHGRYLALQARNRHLHGDFTGANGGFNRASQILKASNASEEWQSLVLRDHADLNLSYGRLTEASAQLRQAAALLEGRLGDAAHLRQFCWLRLSTMALEYSKGDFDAVLAIADRLEENRKSLHSLAPSQRHPYDDLLPLLAAHWRIAALRASSNPSGNLNDIIAAARKDWKALADTRFNKLPSDDLKQIQILIELEAAQTWRFEPVEKLESKCAPNFASLIKIAEDYQRHHPAMPAWRHLYSLALLAQSEFNAHRARWVEAGQDLESAMAILTKLRTDVPDNPYFMADLGRVFCAQARLSEGRPGNSKDLETEGRQLIEAAWASNGQDAWLKLWATREKRHP